MKFGQVTASAQFILCLAAFASLTASFVVSDYSVAIVAMNSHSAKPLLYKITGVWGNHEGSMLLWVLILTLFGACVAWYGSNLRDEFKSRVLAVQAAISLAFLTFIEFTSNPFKRLLPPPFEGEDLNPLLQDPGLAFHPPFLYLGYVGLSITFSFAVAALIEGNVSSLWARWMRPWTLASWIFLTIGIAGGSWWAYYELGWGGWWFWDPVENASLMPWLIATALLHSAIVCEKRDTLKSWTVLLAILAFTLSLTGTFLVRSGIITSVHAFANDPTRGIFILAILGVFSGGALVLYTLRARSLTAHGAFSFVSRETALITNNILLVVATFVVFVGTFWPLISEILFDRNVSVGPPYFERAFTPIFVLLAVILPFGPLLSWKRASSGKAMRKLRVALLLSVSAGSFTWVYQTDGRMLGPLGFLLSAWLIFGALSDLWLRANVRIRDFRSTARRIRSLSRANWGRAIAHAGLGVTILGIAAITAWEIEDIRVAQPGETFEVGAYQLRFEGISQKERANYLFVQAELTLMKRGNVIGLLTPERRLYPVARMQTTEAAIDLGFLRDVYVVIGERQPNNGGWAIKTYVKPLANWIWGGALMTAFGGLLSLADRRLRVAYRFGKRKRSATHAI